MALISFVDFKWDLMLVSGPTHTHTTQPTQQRCKVLYEGWEWGKSTRALEFQWILNICLAIFSFWWWRWWGGNSAFLYLPFTLDACHWFFSQTCRHFLPLFLFLISVTWEVFKASNICFHFIWTMGHARLFSHVFFSLFPFLREEETIESEQHEEFSEEINWNHDQGHRSVFFR